MAPWEAAAGLFVATSGVVASWLDIRHRLLPNWVVLLTAAGGLATAVAGGYLSSSAIHMALALAIGIGLFANRVVGAGDAKYYAALALFFPLQSAALFAWGIGVGGLVLLSGTAVRTALSSERSGAGTRTEPGPARPVPLPFGVALAIGALLAWTWSKWPVLSGHLPAHG